MKKIFTIVLVALFVQVGFAQEEGKEKEKVKKGEDINTLFTKDNLKITGGYISPEIKVGNVYEDMSIFIGGKMGFTFNRKFTLGLAVYGLANNSNFMDSRYSTTEPLRIGMVYGGLAMEYTLFSNKVVHFTIPVVVGAAGVYVYEDNDNFFENDYNEIENSAAFVVEPGVNVEVNIFKFMRLDLGVGYRYVAETDLYYLVDKDLTDLTFNASFKFGFF